jgi:hypothetical protein
VDLDELLNGDDDIGGEFNFILIFSLIHSKLAVVLTAVVGATFKLSGGFG